MQNTELSAIDASIPPDSYDAHVRLKVERATLCPFDQREPVDSAHKAAQVILATLEGRRGIAQALENVDTDVRIEITDILAAVVRKVMAPDT